MWLVMPIITSILHAKYDLNRTQDIIKLLRYHCGCHGKLATIAMRYVADTYHLKKDSYHI